MKPVIYIFVLILTCTLVLMPAAVKVGSRTLYRPVINFQLSGGKIYRDLEFKLGLDLVGGSHLVYQADTAKVSDSDLRPALSATRDNIERRVNLLGVSEALVQTSQVGDKYRLIVELPGVKDINQALTVIGQTAKLDFRQVEEASPGAQPKFKVTSLTGADLKTSSVQFNSGDKLGSQPVVALEFTPDGAKKFADITSKNIGQRLAIFLDDRLVTAPVIQNAITDGRAVISGQFSVDQAKTLAIQLNAGALPLPIKIVEQKNIGATLGSQSVSKSLTAGVIGLGLIWLFMLISYRLQGLVANLVLLLYIGISLALFKLIPVTLTLSGIAGFILSIGMAVDANILIFERFKEELRWGRPRPAALELAFIRAWNSVRDSSISSLLTSGILFWFGSGPVRGFAFTLIVGILVSLFTSVTITRSLLRLIYARK